MYLRLRPATAWDEGTGGAPRALEWQPAGDLGTKARWIYCVHPVRGSSGGGGGEGGQGEGSSGKGGKGRCGSDGAAAAPPLAVEVGEAEGARLSVALFREEAAEAARQRMAAAHRAAEATVEAAAVAGEVAIAEEVVAARGAGAGAA